MTILLDANISWRLVKNLSKHFRNVLHVRHTGLPDPAQDDQIWLWAKLNNAVIITNDQDFINMLSTYGFPPKVVLLRKGNLTTKQIDRLLTEFKLEIEHLGESETYGLLEIY
jgi:predicted nuclease of predicted toxin-antitoxin system